MFMVLEYFWNDDLGLTNTMSTTIIFNKGGDNLPKCVAKMAFSWLILKKESYQRLVDSYTLFILRILSKARHVG